MHYRTLGKTGLRVSEVGFGCWAIGGQHWGKVDDQESLRALARALELGINFFDTADVYGAGHSEELLGRAFAGKRDQVVIATKLGNRIMPDERRIKDFSPAWIREAAEKSLSRLKTDIIDLYQLHSPRPDFEYSDDIVEALERLREAGKIRHYGISLSKDGPVSTGLRVIAGGKRCDVFQVVYNILERGVEKELFPASREAGVGIIARVPLASGFLTGKFGPDVTFPPNDHRSESFPPSKARATVEKVERLRPIAEAWGKTLAQLALQYCLSRPEVSVVIAGAKTPEQVQDNAAAGDGELLTEEETARIRELVG